MNDNDYDEAGDDDDNDNECIMNRRYISHTNT